MKEAVGLTQRQVNIQNKLLKFHKFSNSMTDKFIKVTRKTTFEDRKDQPKPAALALADDLQQFVTDLFDK